jgi:hypothetical protein
MRDNLVAEFSANFELHVIESAATMGWLFLPREKGNLMMTGNYSNNHFCGGGLQPSSFRRS